MTGSAGAGGAAAGAEGGPRALSERSGARRAATCRGAFGGRFTEGLGQQEGCSGRGCWKFWRKFNLGFWPIGALFGRLLWRLSWGEVVGEVGPW